MFINNMLDSAIKEQIVELRAELYVLVDELGLDHSKVLEFSKKLDLLILELSPGASGG
jgi:hypothetical protein